MIQRWKKLGQIFSPSKEHEWLNSHAAVPIAQNISGDIFKIYFSSRDAENRSFTSFITIDITKPHEILDLSISPILKPGKLGEFDDSGAMATSLVKFKGINYLYYIGWNLGVTVPFRNSIGLATSKDGNEFIKFSNGPILDRTLKEPHFVASCCVLPGPDLWRMWYLSCIDWNLKDGKIEHRYHIKYADSLDGIYWGRKGLIAIDFSNEEEYAISTPTVLHDIDCWRMWYSYRGKSYRIGYAESRDGIKWQRLDSNVGITVSNSGWDSGMIEYPYVFDHKNERYMLYNGNQYGKTGFGLAILES